LSGPIVFLFGTLPHLTTAYARPPLPLVIRLCHLVTICFFLEDGRVPPPPVPGLGLGNQQSCPQLGTFFLPCGHGRFSRTTPPLTGEAIPESPYPPLPVGNVYQQTLFFPFPDPLCESFPTFGRLESGCRVPLSTGKDQSVPSVVNRALGCFASPIFLDLI